MRQLRSTDRVLLGVALAVCLGAAGCGDPCARSGTYEFFALRQSTRAAAGDGGGAASCSPELSGTLRFTSGNRVQVELSDGFTRECPVEYSDDRGAPLGRCQMMIDCMTCTDVHAGPDAGSAGEFTCDGADAHALHLAESTVHSGSFSRADGACFDHYVFSMAPAEEGP